MSVKVWFLNLIGFLLLASVIGVVCTRAYSRHSVPGEIVDPRFDSNQGFRDFHNAVYYPVRAFLTGINPYSAEYQSFHPDGRGFPLFAPTTLLIHAPFGFLQLKYSEIAFAASNFALVIWICVLIFRYSRVSNSFCFGSVAILAALIIFCRPGLLNFYGMQITLLHVLGCLWALEYADEYPFLSGVGLMLASCKPTYAIPLAILMFFRGDFRAVLWGAILSALASCVVVVIIAANCGGLESFVEQVNAQYLAAEHPEIPEVATSWTRLDAYSVIPRWTEVPGEWNLNVWIPVLMILFGAICMLFERDKTQRVGSISRTGMLAGVNGALIQIIMASRVAYGLSNTGQGHNWLAVVHPRRQTPLNSTGMVVLLVLALALWFPIVPLAKATTTILLIVFALVNASLLVIKYRKVPAPDGCPNYPLVLPLLGTAACIGFIVLNFSSLFV